MVPYITDIIKRKFSRRMTMQIAIYFDLLLDVYYSISKSFV